MRFGQEGVVTYISTSQKGNRLNEVIVQQNNINHLPFSSKAHLKWTPICIGVDINLHQVFKPNIHQSGGTYPGRTPYKNLTTVVI